MTRALVLGGGGPVGVAWESGLAVGLAAAGVRLGDADFIVGTSAGSIVGSRLALGMDMAATVSSVGSPLPVAGGVSEAMAEMMSTLGEAAASGQDPEEVRVRLGQIALAAPAVPEDDWTGADVFAALAGRDWPAAFRCTAIDTRTGALAVWDHAAGVPLDRAVASSCAVPGVFPPVTIGGARYMDGGMRTPLNADLAAGHGAVIVISVLPLSLPEGISDPMFDSLSAAIDAELAAVTGGGAKLEVITPGEEFLEVSGWGANLMDPAKSPDAYAAGVRQAAAEADRMRAIWVG